MAKHPAPTETQAMVPDEELPVVARLVVEIRSDGRRTVARGALADDEQGTEAAVEIRAGSALELAGSLAKMLMSMPRLLWTMGRGDKNT